jgi:hypothetical protein
MRSTVLALALVVTSSSLWRDHRAQAQGLRICLETKIERVPAHPSFIVEGDYALKAMDGKPLPTAREVIDDNYSRVMVMAEPGTRFSASGYLGATCDNAFVVAQAMTIDKRPPVPTTAWLRFRGPESAPEIDLELERMSAASIRIDWAYSPRDLATGLHATTFANPTAHLATDLQPKIIYLRATPYWIDGTSGPAWEGWVDQHGQDETELRIGSGPAPSTGGEPTYRCPADTTVEVPANPSFVFNAAWTPQDLKLAAFAVDGQRLPVAISTPDPGQVSFTVTATAGTAFQLRRLPIGSCAAVTTFVATSERWRARAPVVTAIDVRTWNEDQPVTEWGYLRLVLAEQNTWGRMRVDWSLTKDELGRADHRFYSAGQSVDFESFRPSDDPPIYPSRIPQRFTKVFVRITPQWQPARGDWIDGAPWLGWLDRDPRTGAITFGVERPVHDATVIGLAEPASVRWHWLLAAALLGALSLAAWVRPRHGLEFR